MENSITNAKDKFPQALNKDKKNLCFPSYGIPLHSQPGCIYVICLPKSGSVWLKSLIKDTFNLGTAKTQSRFKDSTTRLKGSHLKPGSVHSLYDMLYGVYLMRDIRDVIVSYFHYSKSKFYHETMDPSCIFNSIVDFYFEYFLTRLVSRYDMMNHAEFYIGYGLPLVKYERLWDNTLAEMKRLYARWGISYERKSLLSAIEHNTLQSMKEKQVIEQCEIEIPSSHFRKGGYGNWRNELPEIVIQDVNKRFGEYLLRWGYQLG